jgi:hypothetical protein
MNKKRIKRWMVKFTVVSLLCFFSLTVKSQAEGMPILELYKKASPESAPQVGVLLIL